MLVSQVFKRHGQGHCLSIACNPVAVLFELDLHVSTLLQGPASRKAVHRQYNFVYRLRLMFCCTWRSLCPALLCAHVFASIWKTSRCGHSLLLSKIPSSVLDITIFTWLYSGKIQTFRCHACKGGSRRRMNNVYQGVEASKLHGFPKLLLKTTELRNC